MPEIDFDRIDDDVLVGPGWYQMKINDVKQIKKDKGWMWVVEYIGVDPQFGLTDFLTFYGGGRNKIKILYKALGLPHKGVIQCEPSDILDNFVAVKVMQGEWQGKRRMTTDGYDCYRDVTLISDLQYEHEERVKTGTEPKPPPDPYPAKLPQVEEEEEIPF